MHGHGTTLHEAAGHNEYDYERGCCAITDQPRSMHRLPVFAT
jgi:hypothetical protein